MEQVDSDKSLKKSTSKVRRLLPGRRLLVKLSLFGVVTVLAGWFAVPWLVALPTELNEEFTASPELLARDGSPLASFPRPDLFRHRPLALADIPENLILATLAAEDKRFHSHGGIDLIANCRAIRDNIETQDVVSGASTLTQQLIKLSSGTPERTIKNKLIEALQARRLEMSWDKDRILEAYFNRLDYGSQRMGPDAAARYYFQRPPGQLSLAQCALLAGLPQAPSRHNPLRNPGNAIERRNWVLDRMKIVFEFDSASIDRAKAEPLELRPIEEKSLAPHLVNLFRGTNSSGPLKTTIDPELQTFAERVVSEELEKLAEKNAHHAAVIVLDNSNAEILTFVGSGGYENENGGQINGATTKRSPGSTLKPFLYAFAYQQKQSSPSHILPDIPGLFTSAEGVGAPKNYDHRYYGPVSTQFALANSLNIAAMQQLNELGGAGEWMPFLTELGFEFSRPAEEYGLGLAIGNAEQSLLQLAQAYQCLANNGVLRPLTLQAQEKKESYPIISADAAWMVGDILRDAHARAHAFGTTSPLRLDFPCAVKTGTSSDFRDNWCIGFTPSHTVAVWLGNFDNSPMRGISGVTGAGPMFNRIMSRVGSSSTWPSPPETLVQVNIDPRTGKRQLTPSSPSKKIWAFADSPPLPALASDYAEKNKVLLDDRYARWLASGDKQLTSGYLLAKDHRPGATSRITSPMNGSRFALDPDIPGGTETIPLKTNQTGEVIWTCAGLDIKNNDLILKPGTYTIHAKLKNGKKLSSEIVVRQL